MRTQGDSASHGGRFVVGERLGSSEIADVFAARDISSGRHVVLKRARPSQRETIAREHALLVCLSATLGALVPEVAAHGVSEGEPWFATARVDGVNLREFKHKLWEEALDEGARVAARPVSARHVAAVASLGLDLAVALARLHALGIVHGDLSLDNVLMGNDGRLVLIDFEAACRPFHETDQRRSLSSRATPGYAAPESLRGAEIDCRADIYSWACIVRELLVGEPVFSGATGAVVARLHLEAVPRPAASVRPGVPEWLDALLLRLLEKDPRQRRMPACSLVRELASRLGRGDVVDGVRTLSPPLNRPSFLGRHAELRQLQARLESAADGYGGLVLLRGATGSGKTMLLDELAQAARALGFRVLRPPFVASPQIHSPGVHTSDPLRQTRAAADEPFSTSAREPFSNEPERAESANHCPAEPLLPLGRVPSSGLPSDVARRGSFRRCAELLCDLGARQPALALLDDLNAADELSLAFLGSPDLDTLRTSRTLLVAAITAVGPAAFEEVAARSLEVVELRGLDPMSTCQLVQQLLGTESDTSALAQSLHEHCEGNPLLIARALRLARDEQLLRHDATRGWYLSNPSELTGLLLARRGSLDERLQPLGPGARRLASLAAVLGRRFDTADLEALVGECAVDLTITLDELVRHDVIAKGSSGYVFLHESVRLACEHLSSEEERRSLHARVAERLESAARSDVRLARDVGRHWAEAGRADQAIPALLRAVEHLAANHDPYAAIAAARLAMDQLGRMPQEGSSWEATASSIARHLLELYSRTAQHPPLRSVAERLLQRSSDADWRAQYDALVHLARSFRVTGEYAEAAHRLDRAERLLRDRRRRGGRVDEALWIDLQEQRIWLLYMMRHVQGIGPLLQSMAPVVRRAGTATQLASFYMWSANDLVLQNRYQFSPTAVDHERRALKLLEGTGELSQLAMTEFDLAFMLILGDVSRCVEACAHLERARGLAEQLGDPVLTARAATYRAIAERRLGHVSACHGWARVALDEASSSGIRGYIGAAWACLGWVAWRRDEVANSLESFSEALAAWRHRRAQAHLSERDEFPFQWLAHLPLLLIHTSRNDLSKAREALHELLFDTQQRLRAPVHQSLSLLARDWLALSPRQLEGALSELTRQGTQHGYV